MPPENPTIAKCEVKDCAKTHCCSADVMHMMNQHEITDDAKQFSCAIKAKKSA